MRLAVVVQRYGVEVVGGAESQARQIVEGLSRHLSCQIDVLTTTARSHVTWANQFAAGVEQTGPGVRILRFDSARGRSRAFDAFDKLACRLLPYLRARQGLGRLVAQLEAIWFYLQGPVARTLVSYLRLHRNAYDRVVFFTYLYYPTVWGIPHVADKAILIPEAHDEPAFHFDTVAHMLAAVRMILVNTEPERDLVLTKVPARAASVRVAGLGIEVPAARTARRAAGAPYLLYLGRIEVGKGVGFLLDCFRDTCCRPGLANLRLVLAGHRAPGFDLSVSPAVDFRGYVTEEEKSRLLAGALALVNLSPHESLSLAVIEAMAAGVPAIVNARCPVLRYLAQVSGAVRAVGDATEFSEAVQWVLSRDWASPEAAADLDAAREWVRDQCGWDRVLQVYRDALSS